MENTVKGPVTDQAKRDDYLRIVKEALIAGDINRAGLFAIMAVELDEEHSASQYWRGAGQLQERKYKAAIQSLTEASILEPFNADYFALLALAYYRSGMAAYALNAAERGLTVYPNHVRCLQVKALSLIALFRLQEASLAVSAVASITAKESAIEPPVFITEDIGELYERALEIDPFKTKKRLDSLNGIKLQNSAYRTLRKITLVDKPKGLFGFMMLVALAIALSYFIRDNATYRSFSPLLFVMLWGGMGKDIPVNVSTNFGFFFKAKFAWVLQKVDRAMAIRGVICYVLAFAAFFVWHYQHSWIALIVYFVAGGIFAVYGESFPTGYETKSIPYRSVRRKKGQPAGNTKMVALEDAPFELMLQLARYRWVGRVLQQLVKPKIAGRLLVLILVYPLVLFVARIFTDAISYNVIMYGELLIICVFIFTLSASRLFNLKVFYPKPAREFVPGAYVRRTLVLWSVWTLLVASAVLRFYIHSGYEFAGIGVAVVLLFFTSVSRLKTSPDEEAAKKPGLLAYLRANELTDRSHD